MIKFLLIILMFGCVALVIIAIANTIRLNKSKKRYKRIVYHTPKLSSLHGKAFSDYMDYLTRDL